MSVWDAHVYVSLSDLHLLLKITCCMMWLLISQYFYSIQNIGHICSLEGETLLQFAASSDLCGDSDRAQGVAWSCARGRLSWVLEKKAFPQRVIGPWNRLSREMATAPTLWFWKYLGNALSTWGHSWSVLCRLGVGLWRSWWIPSSWVPSSSGCSMILQFWMGSQKFSNLQNFL